MKNKFSIAMSLALVLALLAATIAFADNIANNLDVSVDANFEIMSLNIGGSDGSTVLRIIEQNGDGKNGCNLTGGGSQLTVSVTTSNPSVATVSPASVTFNGCNDTRTITVTPVGLGTADITLGLTSFTTSSSGVTSSSFELVYGRFTVNVAPPPNTAPVVAVTGVTHGLSYEFGTVPAADCSVEDVEDGNSTFSASLSSISGSLSEYGLGTQTATCSYTDAGGLNVIVEATYEIVDTTAPALMVPTNFSVEATSASGASVTYSATATDSVDSAPVVNCIPASGSQFALGDTTVTCDASDVAGNDATQTSFVVSVVDTTAPVIAAHADVTEEATSADGAVVTYTAPATTDAVDGAGSATCAPASGSQFALGDTTVNCDATDAAGNDATQTSFVVDVVDTTEPIITFDSRTAANGNGWNNDNVTVEWSCSDTVGVLSATVSETISTEDANQSATGICTDTSGNTASDTQTGINIDKTAPSASASRTPAANANGWNNSDVTVSFSGTDGLSGIDSCSADQVFAEGSNQSASGICTDEAGNVSNAATVLNINVDKTAPTISGAPDRAPNANDWYNANVIVSFTCGDALSGVASCSTPSTLGEGAGQSVPGSVTDKAGNSANTNVSGINIDKTNPVISASLDKTPDVNGWFNISTGVPTVSFVCSDELSGVNGACPAPNTFGEGEDQAYNQSISDLAGNSASAGVSSVDVDTVAPSISASINPARPAGGWWNIASGAPTVTYTCSDGTSGIASCTTPNTFSEGEDQTHSGTAYDNAGNSASTSVNDVDVDLTAPTVSITPARGTDYNGWYNAPVDFSFSATDTTSGVNSCDPSANYNGPDSATANVSGSCADKAGNTDLASVVFQYDNTDPSISASVFPSVSGTGWWNLATGAPTVSFTCGDATAAVEFCAASNTFGNGENQDFTGAVTDNAGNTNSASVSDIDVDLIAPFVAAELDRSADGTTGWFNASTGAPTVEFTCSDSGSSYLADCPDNYLFGEGAGQYRNGIAYDNAGNFSSAGVIDVDVDTAAPSIQASLLPVSPAASGWYNVTTGAPTVSYACSDATSGLAVTCPADYTFGNGENQSHSGTVSDNAGNSNSANVSNVDVDLVDPTLAWSGGPASGGSYDFGSVPVAPTCAAADTLSGQNGCIVGGYSNAVGPHTMTATAEDVAGNTYSESRSYSVLGWLLNGFYQPVDMNNVYNVVRNGSTVPLKFEIFTQVSGLEITDTSFVNILSYAQVACSLTSAEDLVETLATGGTVLRYDTTGGQFIFNWKTPTGTAGRCFRVTMTTDDGGSLIAFFKMK